MEEIVRKIVTESESSKLSQIVSQSNEAIEILCDKMSLMRLPMNEMRDKCFQIFNSCLTIGGQNTKLIHLSVTGMQFMLRNQIYWTVECKDDEKQLPSQLIQCISSTIVDQKESTQLELLSVLSEMSSTIPSLISLDNVEDVIEMCCKLSFHSAKHQMAIEATASQSCHQFLKYCLNSESQTESLVDEEVIPLLDLIINKLKLSQNEDNISVLLKCVHYFFITIPDDWPLINDIIVDIVWKTLIPTLIKNLSPIDMNECSSKAHDSCGQLSDGKQLGRGSESLNKKQNICHKKTIFKITSELLRLFGRISSLRPALESLFHRILLYPPVPQRLDALKWVQELLKNTSLVVISSIEPIECFGKSSRSKDLDLFHIILDSLEECSLSSDQQICLHSISAIVTFLRCLQTICASTDLKPDIIERIDSLYPTLIDADFEGFDVRQTKPLNESKDNFEIQTKVSLEILKKRIIGFDGSEEPLESCEQSNEPPKKETNNESIRRSLRNFKVEAYKSKLKEILGSKSTDSESQDIDNQNQDNESHISLPQIQEPIATNGINEKIVKESKDAKLGSRSTSYEELEEFQKSSTNSNSSCTEGPEFEDCVEQLHERKESLQMSDYCPLTDTESIHLERNNARRFINALQLFLPKLLSLRTSIEADHALQMFASNYCTDLFEQQKSISNTNQSNTESCLSYKTIINADGIYLSTYSTLLLNLKLIHSNFYNNSSATIPLTEQEFIEDLHSSGILVYISSYWLAELYQRVLSDNILVNAGYKPDLNSNIALINLLTDIDGLDSFQPGAQQLSDYRRLEKAVNRSLYIDITESAATHKLVRRLLTAFWDTILGCLGTVFRIDSITNELSNAIAINALLGNDNKTMNSRKEMITLSLDGLQMAAKLCIQLGLQSRCDTVFELLALSVIDTKSQPNIGTPNKTIKQIRRSVIEVIKNRQPFSLHTSHVLSLQVLLSCSLEIGSHCTACWRYVFKCCQYIIELEHHYFTSRHSSLLSSTRTSISSLIKPTNKQNSDLYSNFSTNIDSTSMPGINEFEEMNTQSCIEQLISETNSHTSDSVLKDKQLERVIDILSRLVDLLFEDAANKLNLRSLNSFLNELCICSAEQLNLMNKLDENCCPLKSLLLFRLSDVMLRCAKSGRPLMHFMKCWSVVASHLVEGATHSDHSVAKKSVSTLHDIMNVILCSHNELPHFHFNEALFKPFENLLLLELCDTDIQELIISSICEFVEGTTEEIRSGWRSLFGALRGIRLPEICRQSDNYNELETEKGRQLRVILDIFEAFLHTDNLQVFANAAVDCMLCLIKLIKSQQTITNQTNPEETIGCTEYPDLCLISLKYLDQFSSMLRSMYQMPGCPLFSNNRLLRSTCPHSKLIDISHLPEVKPLEIEVSLERLDRSVRILRVWFLLVEEFTQAIEKCEQKHRKTAIEILFNWFKSFFDIPGPSFAIYCINHILMPSLQRITRQTLNNYENSSTTDQISVSTLRHLYGLTADLVVSGIELLKTNSNGCDLTDSTIYGLELMLKQSLLVYIECLNGKYHESVAKLSCACIRHILLSVRTHFDHNLWQTTIDCLWTAYKITLQSLEALVNVFNNKNQNFFDDFDQIQVISKRDANEDSEQLTRLAQQIFLLDAQRNNPESHKKWSASDGSYNSLPVGDNRSFIFLINSSNDRPLMISFRELVIQLTSHWLLLQTISCLLLSGIIPLMPNLQKLVDTSDQKSKPSVLLMDENQCKSLLSLLDYSYRIAFNFDSKLGLKFLMQKISRSDVPSNLYQFSSLVWSVRVVLNVFIINDKNLSNDYFRNDLRQTLSDLSERYSQIMIDNETEEIKIDDICHQSLHFLQTSTEELMNIIGNKNISQNIFPQKDEKIVEQSEDQIEGQTEEEIKTPGSHNSDEERVETLENDIKVYSLATEQKIHSLVAEYKKYKTQLSPIPPNANSGQTSKRALNERQSNSIEKNSENFTLKDSQAFTALWSEIIGQAIDLHLSLPLDRFNQLVPIFLPSIQCLTINCNHKPLRSQISLWMTRIVENSIKVNERND